MAVATVRAKVIAKKANLLLELINLDTSKKANSELAFFYVVPCRKISLGRATFINANGIIVRVLSLTQAVLCLSAALVRYQLSLYR